MKYNKLVRDRIPEIIENTGKKFKCRTATDEEHKNYLRAKLLEEVDEFLQAPSSEEMADILEVIEALTEAFELRGIESLQIAKRIERGSFVNKTILEWVED
jgi:predicted house-cleaning noncanonical NTP pyrophosphatase (MazG superfamily)